MGLSGPLRQGADSELVNEDIIKFLKRDQIIRPELEKGLICLYTFLHLVWGPVGLYCTSIRWSVLLCVTITFKWDMHSAKNNFGLDKV